jgi:NAD(P)-dependent dehydrogenase (short-subunit alcohol dehydrogenase family)
MTRMHWRPPDSLGGNNSRLLASRPGADAIVWRCSDQASFVTGATLPVDGTQHDGTKPPQMYR